MEHHYRMFWEKNVQIAQHIFVINNIQLRAVIHKIDLRAFMGMNQHLA
jgi:hypothetical protein